MRARKLAISVLFFTVLIVPNIYGQAESAKTGSDVLILNDGEKLVGQLESATSESVIFKSDMAGEITVEWKNVRELHSSREFAAVKKNVKLRHKGDTATVPQGTVAASNQQLQLVSPKGEPQTAVPVADLASLVDETSFQQAFGHRSFTQGWKGGATAGVSLTEATQTNQTFTAAVNLVRAVPGESWLDLRSRTIFNFNEAYGKLTSPGSPSVKTSLFHLDGEQDWFLSPRLFTFAGAAFDHSFSQGLTLQQTYGGGLGFVVFKEPNQELDFKASIDYIDRRFEISSLNQHLIGSIFGETYVRTFAHGILLNEQAGITPSWNDTSAYSAFASAGLTFPVYHRFGLTLGALDNFLNDPPPGFKKNSFQFTVGATYAFK